MSDVFWAGDERAAELFGAAGFVATLTAVEFAWLDALVATGLAPEDALVPPADRPDLTSPAEVEAIAVAAEGGGNPVIPLVKRLRERLGEPHPVAASWLHQGLTSQDVLDTGLIVDAAGVLDRLRQEFTDQVVSLRRLGDTHRHTLMAGRTLTQFAVPITFGLKAAGWLQGVLDAAEQVEIVRSGLHSQFGGAAGTLAATVELARRAGRAEPVLRAEATVARAAQLLGLDPAPPWATSRAPITRIGDALVGCTDAWGRVANDVLTLSRPEIAELAEPTGEGRGSSSTMPQKQNPVLSVLIRRSALTAPMLGAQLHLAAADSGDERPAGAWHTEWAALRTLARHTVSAAGQAGELLAGLQVDAERMRATLEAASPGILAEWTKPSPVGLEPSAEEILGRALDEVVDDLLERRSDPALDPRGYLGTSERTIDATLARADRYLEGA